ncbi:MAG: energy transducer TonB [Sphingobium sp.]|nr:energy transducer TonB [Sphingobium sp.]
MKASFDIDFRARRAEPLERSAYRRARGQDPIVTAAALALVGLVGSAFVSMSPIFVKKQTVAPTVVTLLSLPDNPPPEQPQPELDKSAPPPVAIVTPPPQVALPQPAAPQVAQMDVAKPSPPAPQVAPAPPVPAPRGPENLGEISAKMISAKPPRYPMDSRRAHEQGTVVLSVLLSTDGRVSDISVMRSSGFSRLDRAALDAVRDWRWSPLLRDGSAVTVRGVVTIPFVLQGGDGGSGRGHGRDRGHRDGGDNSPDGGGADFGRT